jgi:hypothetical protein
VIRMVVFLLPFLLEFFEFIDENIELFGVHMIQIIDCKFVLFRNDE